MDRPLHRAIHELALGEPPLQVLRGLPGVHQRRAALAMAWLAHSLLPGGDGASERALYMGEREGEVYRAEAYARASLAAHHDPLVHAIRLTVASALAPCPAAATREALAALTVACERAGAPDAREVLRLRLLNIFATLAGEDARREWKEAIAARGTPA